MAVKENELRIGNIIQSVAGVWLVVLEIHGSGITYDRFDMQAVCDHAEWKDVKGVKLTPQILEQFRFMRQNNGWHLIKDDKRGYMDDIFGLFDNNYCVGDLNLRLNGSNLPMPQVKYLHTLQNLYFLLCGKELTINL